MVNKDPLPLMYMFQITILKITKTSMLKAQQCIIQYSAITFILGKTIGTISHH